MIVDNSEIVNPCEHLAQDVASLTRVRNRLAHSPDDKLPTILTGLLPRLLARLEKQTLLPASDTIVVPTQEQYLRQQLQIELSGILAHALDRIRGNSSISVFSWVEALLPALKLQNAIASTWALTFLQAGLVRCTNESLPASSMVSLIECVDDLHSHEVAQSVQIRLSSASWIFLDLIAISVGLTPLVDWDMDYFGDPRWESQKSDSWRATVPASAIAAIDKNGTGVFHLLLDLLLFWPSSWDPHRIRESTGVSEQGETRMNHRRRKGQQWTDIAQAYLRHLKLAGLRCAIWPAHEGLFRGDRALVLSVLLVSYNSMHGRLAADYLNQYDGAQRLVKIGNTYNMTPSTCSLSVVCSLLILILGDATAQGVLQTFEKKHDSRLWEQVVGPLPTDESLQRPCLPLGVSARAIDFILRHPVKISKSESDKPSVRLLIDLALVLAEQHKEGKYWAIQLINMLYGELIGSSVVSVQNPADDWTREVIDKCLTACTEVLSVVVEVGETNVAQERRDPRRPALPLGVPAPFNNRNDLNRLLNSHRNLLKRKGLGDKEAMQARQAAYQMIVDLAAFSLSRHDKPFEIPIVLLKCAVHEKETMQPHVTGALDALLEHYKLAFSSGSLRASFENQTDAESSLQHQAVPLLPPLLDAVCSDSIAAKTAAAKWISQLLCLMDPQAARHLALYLMKGADFAVTQIAKKVLDNDRCSAIDSPMKDSVATLIDSKNDEELSSVQIELEGRVRKLSTDLSIPLDAALMVLHDFDFSLKAAELGVKVNFDAAKHHSGLVAHLDGMGIMSADMAATNRLCSICYEEIASPEVLSCHCEHEFCRQCWQSYLNSTFAEGKHQILKARCPHHECNERVTLDDIKLIAPKLELQWKGALLESFIEKDPCYRFCPGPDCKMIAKSNCESPSSRAVTCISCDTSFCFRCGESPHEPARCDDFADWNRIFGSSEFWIKKNAKPCPGCNVPIEKDMGCNHMTCNKCSTQFCWLCLTKLRAHSEAHSCNRYDPSSNSEDDSERHALFVTDRFNAHEVAERFAVDQAKDFENKAEKLFEMFWFLTDDDEEIFRMALETLVCARNFLKYSYVASFGMKKEPARLAVFEKHQATLEMFTERLSQLTETNLHPLYMEKGEYCINTHFRALSFYQVSVSNYMERILSMQF